VLSPLDLHAQDLGEHRGIGGDETALRNLRRLGKTRFLRIRSRFPPSPEAVPDVVLTEIESNGSRSRDASYEHAPSDCQLDVIDVADLQSSRAEPRSRT
jgi:hypothetical protein